MVNFIGVGAQKAGTSWIYACLYEHPEICAPIKEIHFFSRKRFQKGKEWYEHHFRNCGECSIKGEFSTSYLYSKDAPERMALMYPDVQIIMVFRNPIHRAYSQYRNAIKAGEIKKGTTFDIYQESELSVLGQGLYSEQLARYFTSFKRVQILFLVYEDSRKDPSAFIRQIYQFLGVEDSFVPSMLNKEINIARTPHNTRIEQWMSNFAGWLRMYGFDGLVWKIRKLGLPDLVRSINTDQEDNTHDSFDRKKLIEYFKDDVKKLSDMIDRDLNKEWNI